MARYDYRTFDYVRPAELDGGGPERPVVIVGAGPAGLAAAIDLALHGVPTVVLDDNNVVSVGSRAICWAKRTLEIFDRLGVGDRMRAKGVTWNVGRVFHKYRELYAFDLQPEPGHKSPAFINLQQYYVEQYLIDRARDFPDLIELRFLNRLTGLERSADRARLRIETPDGAYALDCRYLLACDGAGSTVRSLMGLDFKGRVFEERFLIADVEMKADFPSERWFWFEPPFHPGQSALLHKQPDDIYRIDLQLGWDADPEAEKHPDKVIPRIRAMVGDVPFELEWVSVYTFQCRRLQRFLHGPVIFAGDSAHVVSPFGARGGNGGIQDVDNLCWKLATALRGEAGDGLLESYDEERTFGADENILNSSRSTGFMSPRDGAERAFRDETLALAGRHAFARRLVNSGRLSVPCSLAGMALQSPDAVDRPGPMVPGAACLDAPIRDVSGKAGWLLDHLGGDFVLMTAGIDGPEVPGLRSLHMVPGGPAPGPAALGDADGLFADRYGAAEGLSWLIRPDQHIAARFLRPGRAEIERALSRALGKS